MQTLVQLGEERHLLPGTAARPGDVMIWRWSNGKDGAIDVTVTSPLAASNVEGAAAEAGASLNKAVKRKLRDTAEACSQQGLVFLPETSTGSEFLSLLRISEFFRFI